MKLKEAINASGKTNGATCSFVELMASLSPADLADLIECLADPRYTSAQIGRGLEAEGYPVKRTTVQRHRAGDCCCGAQ